MVAQDDEMIVVGSQSILGSYGEDDLPAAATLSAEADVVFDYDADGAKTARVNADLGEMSDFHGRNDYYADGVGAELVVLPTGWRDRLVAWDQKASLPANPRFLDPHDLAVSKLAAHREKDRVFVTALLDADLIDVATTRERVGLLDDEDQEKYAATIEAWLDGYEAGPGGRREGGTPSRPGGPGPRDDSGLDRGRTVPGTNNGSFKTPGRPEADFGL